VLARLAQAVRPGGALVLGAHETRPGGDPTFTPWSPAHHVYRRTHAGHDQALAAEAGHGSDAPNY